LIELVFSIKLQGSGCSKFVNLTLPEEQLVKGTSRITTSC